MQQMFNAKCCPEEYQRQGKSFSFPDMTKEPCPKCKKDSLKPHGFYDRWLCVIGFSGEIVIRRFICKACRRTVSLLPSFAHPRMGYGMSFIIGILELFYLEDLGVVQAAKKFQENTGLSCSRQLLRQFIRRFEKNLNCLVMEIIALLKLQSPPVTAPADEKKKRARQFLECIRSSDTEDVPLNLFERSGTAYLAAPTD